MSKTPKVPMARMPRVPMQREKGLRMSPPPAAGPIGLDRTGYKNGGPVEQDKNAAQFYGKRPPGESPGEEAKESAAYERQEDAAARKSKKKR